MGIWSSILGKGDTISKGLDIIDNAFYTDQERADMKKELLRAFEPFKKAQRQIAIYILRMFIPLFFLEVALALLGAKYPICWEMVSVLNSLEVVQYVAYSYLALITLYYTGGVAAPILAKFGKK